MGIKQFHLVCTFIIWCFNFWVSVSICTWLIRPPPRTGQGIIKGVLTKYHPIASLHLLPLLLFCCPFKVQFLEYTFHFIVLYPCNFNVNELHTRSVSVSLTLVIAMWMSFTPIAQLWVSLTLRIWMWMSFTHSITVTEPCRWHRAAPTQLQS